MAQSDTTAAQSGKGLPIGAFVMLLAGMAFFGSATPVSKIVTGEFPTLGAAGARFILAGILLLPFALRREASLFSVNRHDFLLLLGVAVIGNIGFTVFLLHGMAQISGVLGSAIMSLTPAVTAFGAALFLHERLSWRKIAALAVGVTGVLVIQLGGGTDGGSSADGGGQWAAWAGASLVFLAICCEAAYTLFGKQIMADISPLKLTTLSALLAGVILLPWTVMDYMTVIGESGADLREWSALLWWGIGTMALGSLFWYRGVKAVPGHIAAGFMVVMPISALLLSYVLLGESFHWSHAAGFALAVAGVGAMAYEHARHGR